eukprot:1726827-Rhodomonas_salina.1
MLLCYGTHSAHYCPSLRYHTPDSVLCCALRLCSVPRGTDRSYAAMLPAYEHYATPGTDLARAAAMSRDTGDPLALDHYADFSSGARGSK